MKQIKIKIKNNSRRVVTLAALMLALLLGFAACVSEIENTPGTGTNPGTEEPDTEVTFTLALNIPAATRSLTQSQEEAIRQVDVLVFNNSTQKLTDWKYGILENNGATFTVTLKASQGNSDRYRLMVLANARTMTYSLFSGPDLGGHLDAGYDDVCAALEEAIPSLSLLAANGLPMWGELDNLLLNANNSSQALTLVRSLARIDVGTNPNFVGVDGQQIDAATYDELPNFSLEGVYVYNRNTQYRAVPDRANFDFAADTVTTFTLPAGNAKGNTAIYNQVVRKAATSRGVSLLGEIYCGEADIKMGGTAGKEYADANHPNRMALIIAGYYTAPDQPTNTTVLSYYRIDFTNGGTSTNLNDILRNNVYQIVIIRAAGPGSTTPEKAYETYNADLVLNISKWTSASLEKTVIDGDYYLTVDPYEYTTDKWAKTDLIEVKTNVAETAGIAWTATIAPVTTGEDTSWLTLVDGFDEGGQAATLKFDIADVPAGSPETYTRSAYIRITAGNMTNTIKVTQTGKDAAFLLRLSQSEFIFTGRKWDATNSTWIDPDPQTLTVNWGPKTYNYDLDLSSYTGGGITGFNPPADSDDPVVTITPAAIDPNDPKVIDNPFYERSSRLGLTAWDKDHNLSITKQVMIKQIFYSLVLTNTKDYYYQGRSYTFNIKANTNWVTSIEDDHGILTSLSGQTGTGNTTSGQTFRFSITAGAQVGARAYVTFSSPTNLFPPQTVTIIAQDVHPNSYIVPPGAGGFSFPVSKAYRVWELDRDLFNDSGESLPAGARSVELLWQDKPGLISSLNLSTQGKDAWISLDAANEEGNAVVAYKIDGVTYWSWHIWVTAYNPETNHVTVTQGTTDYYFMDRNLGASGNSGYEAYGLFYQGSRKDPFPPTKDETTNTARTIYDAAGTATSMTSAVSVQSGGLPVVIKNPMTFYKGTYTNLSWYGQFVDMRIDLWNDGATKSDYDPCPEGWKVQYISSITGIASFDYNIQDIWVNGVYYPRQGHINSATFGYSSNNVGLYTLITRNNASPMLQNISNLDNYSTIAVCFGCNVRCIKE